MGKAPEKFMTDLKTTHISLVDKGANKRRFAMFKMAQGQKLTKEEEEVLKGMNPEEIKKMYDGCPMGSSFKAALAAVETQEELEESRYKLDEYFWILKQTMRGVLDDETVSDKPAALKKNINEFKTSVDELFSELPIQKQRELLTDSGGSDMKTKPDATTVEKAKGDGISENGQQAASNRNAPAADVAGISKAEKRLSEIAQLKKGIESDIVKLSESAAKKKEDREKMKKQIERLEEYEAEEVELQKAVGTREGDSPATGVDQVATNGEEATTATDDGVGSEAAAGGNGVAKADGSESTGPTAGEPKVGGGINETTGNISSKPSTPAMKKGNVDELTGQISALSNLFSGGIAKMQAAVDEIGKRVDSIEKASGVPNSREVTIDTESALNADIVQKSEDALWAGATDSFGSLRPVSEEKEKGQ